MNTKKKKIFDWLFAPTTSTSKQLFRNVFVGLVAFLVDYVGMILIVEFLHIHYLVAQLISNLAGGLVNYFLSLVWVFDKKPQKKGFLHFVIFTIIGLVGLGLNTLFLWLFTDVMGIYYMYSKLLSTVLAFLFNFYIRKYLLFK